MKTLRTVLPLVISCFAATALGQTRSQPAVKASVVVHGDGTRTLTTTKAGSTTVESQLQSANGKLIRKTTSKLHADGRAASSKTVDSRGRVLWTEAYEYGDAGQLLGLRRFRPDGSLLFRTEVTVDAKGISKIAKMYDSKGKPIPQSQWGEYMR